MANAMRIIVLVAFVSLSIQEQLTEGKNVTIFYLNDLRYDIFSVDSADNGYPVCVDDDTEAKADPNCVGGLARLSAAFEDEAVLDANPTLWLNAGNVLGGANYNMLKFTPAAEAVELLQFNASALGPELFRYGLDPSGSFLDLLKNTPVLAANWQQNAAVRKSLIIPLGESCHAAIIGFIDKQKVEGLEVFGITVEDEKVAIEQEVVAIKAANSDKKLLYIALGSTSIERAKSIATIPDIDLVIFSGGNFSATDKPEERAFLESVVVANNKTNWVSSVNRNFWAMDSRFLIGRLDLALNDECKIAIDPGKPLVEYLNTDKTDNEEILNFLHNEAGKIAALSEVVARSKVNLLPTPDACTVGECSLGGLVADALVAKLNAMNETLPWGESVKLAVIPGSIIRNVENATGQITAQMLYNLFAQDEFLYTVTLTARQLKELFETSVSQYKDSKTPMPDLLQVSGSLRVEFSEKTVVSIWAVSDTSDTLALTLVDLTDSKATYVVAVPSSLLYQSESYKFLRDVGQPQPYDTSVVDALRGLVTRTTTDNYLSLPPTGVRLIWRPKTSPPAVCADNTAESVILTLVVITILVASGLIVWKIVLPKYRMRRGSTTHLLP